MKPSNNIANVPDSPRLVVFHVPTYEEEKNNIIDMSTNTDDTYEESISSTEESRLVLDETNMRILIGMNNKIEKMSLRVKQLVDNNTCCIDCLCRCFSCTSFILSILSFIK